MKLIFSILIVSICVLNGNAQVDLNGRIPHRQVYPYGIDNVMKNDSISEYSLQVPSEPFGYIEWYKDSTVAIKQDLRTKLLSMPQKNDAAIVIDKSPDLLTTPHGTCIVNDIIFVGSRVGTATIIRFNDPSDLSNYSLKTFTDYDRLESMVYSSVKGKIYSTMRSSIDNNIRILEIDPNNLNSYTIHNTGILGASTPAICTDGNYIYGGSYTANPTLFKINTTTWAITTSVTMTGWSGVHAAEINIPRGEFYVTSGGGDEKFAVVSMSNLAYTEVDISNFVETPTDDIAFIDDGVVCKVFVCGEKVPTHTQGLIYSGVAITTTNSNALEAMPIFPGWGIFKFNNIIMTCNVGDGGDTDNNGLQIFSIENFLAMGDYRRMTLQGYQPNEIFITSDGKVFFTDFATNNGVLFRISSDGIFQDFYPTGGTASGISITDVGNYFTSNNVEGALQELGAGGSSGGDITAVIAGDLLTGGATSGPATLNVNLGLLANDVTATTSDYIPWIDVTNGQKKMLLSNLQSLIGAGTSLWTSDSYGIHYNVASKNVGIGVDASPSVALYLNKSLPASIAATNTSATGEGIIVSVSSNSSSYDMIRAGGPVGTAFKVRSDGKVLAPKLTNSYQANVVGFNSSTGEFTYFPTPSGGGVTDGDKGEITVTGSGLTWAIDNNTIGLEKLKYYGYPTVPGNGYILTYGAYGMYWAPPSSASSWTDDGVNVRLSTRSDVVSLGNDPGSFNQKLYVKAEAGLNHGIYAETSTSQTYDEAIIGYSRGSLSGIGVLGIADNGIGLAGSGSVADVELQTSGILSMIDISSYTPAPTVGAAAINNYLLSKNNNPIFNTRLGQEFNLSSGTGNDFVRFPMVETDFMGTAAAATTESTTALDFVAISSGTHANIASQPNHPGIISISSSNSANSGAYIRSSNNSILISNGEVFEAVFQARVASNANTTIRMGFFDTSTSSDATDGVYVELIPGSLNLIGKTSYGGTRASTTTIATLTVNSWYRIKIEIDAPATVTYTLFNNLGIEIASKVFSTVLPNQTGEETGVGVIATNSSTTSTILAYFDMISFYYKKALTR